MSEKTWDDIYRAVLRIRKLKKTSGDDNLPCTFLVKGDLDSDIEDQFRDEELNWFKNDESSPMYERKEANE